jgi:hypothetical protein
MKRVILNSLVIVFLLLLAGFLMYQNVSQPSMIKVDNLELFLGTDGSVLRSQEIEGEKVKKIAIYFPETKQNNYLQHERYQIFLDDKSFMQTMYERATKTGDIFAAYVFYPDIKYSQNFLFGVKQAYVFKGQDHAIEYGIEYRRNSREKEIVHYYEYYPDTKFNENPEQNIKAQYVLDKDGFVEYSIEREQGTGREVAKHYYEQKTPYDETNFSHRNKITNSEQLTAA